MWEMECLCARRPVRTTASHTHIHTKPKRCRPAYRECGVLGGADQEVNMIQSCTFISWMEVITAYGDDRSYTPTPGLQRLETLLSCLEECENSRICEGTHCSLYLPGWTMSSKCVSLCCSLGRWLKQMGSLSQER